jgi:hypothetical protein
MRIAGIVLTTCLLLVSPALGAPASPEFFKTQNSDEWVEHSIKVQAEYKRVLLVTAADEAPGTVEVAALDLNSREPAGEKKTYDVTRVFKTLQEAADASEGGDLVAVMPGVHAGFAVGERPGAGDGAYIHFKALGDPGEVTIDRPAEGKDRNWMVMVQAGHHVIIDGFDLAGTTGPGLDPVGPRAGIFLDGDFTVSSKLTHHVVVINNFSHNHRSWGLHSTDTHTVLMQGNLFALSCQEHSAYVSDGSDNYVIRRNIFFASRSSGLQCNLDPQASTQELLRHPELAPYGEMQPTREWAEGLLSLATEKFGEHNFPDGRGVNFIIEDNVVNGNGKGGGGSFNFAGLQESLIQNNLVYENFTTGIAGWDNMNPYDAPLANPGPSDPEKFKGLEDLPIWGCHSNIIRNNTVMMQNPSRMAFLLWHGSWGNKVRNNIFINDQAASIEVSASSIYKLDSGYNVAGALDMPEAVKALATNLDEGNNSILGVTEEQIAKEFVKFNKKPWVIIEGNRWRLNPDRPDMRPVKGSALLVGKGDSSEMPLRDLAGKTRAKPDIGAYAAVE